MKIVKKIREEILKNRKTLLKIIFFLGIIDFFFTSGLPDYIALIISILSLIGVGIEDIIYNRKTTWIDILIIVACFIIVPFIVFGVYFLFFS